MQRQIAGLFVAEERGAHELKGVPEPVTLFQLVRASGGGRRAGQRQLTPLVGREEEIAMMMRRWERARQGDGQLVMIVGEPGLGKSRLIEELHARLADTPHTWVEWSCSQLLQNTPLHPIAEWGRQRFGGADVPAERRLAELESSLAQVKLDPAENVASARAAPRYSAAEGTRIDFGAGGVAAPAIGGADQLGDGWRQGAAGGAGVRGPALGRSDHARCLARLRRARRAGAVVHRGDDAAGISRRPGACARTTARSRLRRSIAPRFATWWQNFPPATRCRESGRRRCRAHRRRAAVCRGGNSAAVGARRAGRHPGYSADLQQSLMARLDRLGPAREVAQIGSVIGRGFSYALLRAVAGMDDAALQVALERLAEADILLVQGLPPEADYRFKHALIQDAAYENLLKSRRQILHRRVAETLRDKFTAIAATEPELLAHQFTQAGMTDAAIEWWGKAGDQALRRSAFQEAIAHLGKAIEMADKDAESPQRSTQSAPTSLDRRLRLQTNYGHAIAMFRGFSSDETKAAFTKAQQMLAGIDDPSERYRTYRGALARDILERRLGVGARDRRNFLARRRERLSDNGNSICPGGAWRYLLCARGFWERA